MWTGIIFAAIAVAWLAYLVPTYLRSRDNETGATGDVDRFADSMRVVARGTAPLVDHDGATLAEIEVSTPLTRRAAVRDIKRLEALAARRRRRVLLGLMVVLSVVVGLCAASIIPWWAVAVPGVLLVGFVVVARFSVQSMRRSLTQRFEAIMNGSDEVTVYLSRQAVAEADEASVGIDLSAPVAKSLGGLWDPLPITMPTYVSKPLAPRTVRTIDLSSPEVTSSARRTTPDVPVTADGPIVADSDLDEQSHISGDYDAAQRPRAVGE
ncbi:hypothetical protein ACQBAR_04230 [Propionibacteriaceae bacterium Y1685]|uniref:divisome protein SepX/GlpR n=1 Tax=Microlunatus sp. Y1700 TaxID=3418487 RepID=UPI003B7EAF6C